MQVDQGVREAAPDRAGVPRPRCAACHRLESQRPVCSRCLGRLVAPIGVACEQISAAWLPPVLASLVDAWGNYHAITSHTLVGRWSGASLQIRHGAISRRHASIARSARGWWLTDLDSANGTMLAATKIARPVALRNGHQVAFAGIPFYFVDAPPAAAAVVARHTTVRLPGLAAGVAPVAKAPPVRLVETPSAGGFIYPPHGGAPLSVTSMQLELLRVLLQRMASDSKQAQPVQGFVSTPELLGQLAWKADAPTPSNLKQLVHRLRMVLDAARAAVQVESRRGLGYRLVARVQR